MTLDQARQKAREWLELVGRGIDPKVEETRRRAAAQRRELNSFAAVAAEFLERHASGLKKSAEAKRITEGEFVKRWGARPITDITPEEVAAASQWNGGEYVFSTAGKKPVNGFSKAKVRIDKLSGVSDWVIHDFRRTMRTHLFALPVQDLVRELVIAHAKPGLPKVYDQHAYQNEKRHCLSRWEKRLISIVEPRPGGMADLAETRERKRAEAAT